jgi:hypothetical protein
MPLKRTLKQNLNDPSNELLNITPTLYTTISCQMPLFLIPFFFPYSRRKKGDYMKSKNKEWNLNNKPQNN